LLISRLSNMVQAPFAGILVDKAVSNPSQLPALSGDFRLVIASACLGTCLGALLCPTFLTIARHAIQRFYTGISFPRLLLKSLSIKTWYWVGCHLSFPHPKHWKNILKAIHPLPKDFLWLNIVVTAIYTIGVLCALYAGACEPQFRATAIQLSGIVNGLATILLTLVVDPTHARFTDQTMNGQLSIGALRAVVAWMLISRLIGTGIVAQLLFKPFSSYIQLITVWLGTAL